MKNKVISFEHNIKKIEVKFMLKVKLSEIFKTVKAIDILICSAVIDRLRNGSTPEELKETLEIKDITVSIDTILKYPKASVLFDNAPDSFDLSRKQIRTAMSAIDLVQTHSLEKVSNALDQIVEGEAGPIKSAIEWEIENPISERRFVLS